MTHICVNFQQLKKKFGQTQCYPGQKQTKKQKNVKPYWIMGGIFCTFVARENRKSKGGYYPMLASLLSMYKETQERRTWGKEKRWREVRENWTKELWWPW